jgi:hypothetical protein
MCPHLTSSPRALRASRSCGWNSPGKALLAATADQISACNVVATSAEAAQQTASQNVSHHMIASCCCSHAPLHNEHTLLA